MSLRKDWPACTRRNIRTHRQMWFLISLAALLYASLMAWLSGNARMVILCWIVWGAGFFAFPAIFASGWPFIGLQAALAVALLIRWKIDEI